jgi:hypothetical protein
LAYIKQLQLFFPNLSHKKTARIKASLKDVFALDKYYPYATINLQCWQLMCYGLRQVSTQGSLAKEVLLFYNIAVDSGL